MHSPNPPKEDYTRASGPLWAPARKPSAARILLPDANWHWRRLNSRLQVIIRPSHVATEGSCH
eukprot:3080916-Prorocentrum_lima.AAC.1